MSLGKMISSKRKEKHMTQEQLADEIAVSRSAVAKWETDRGIPGGDTIVLLSRTLEIPVDQLLLASVEPFMNSLTKSELK